jgi:hypothetical protein
MRRNAQVFFISGGSNLLLSHLGRAYNFQTFFFASYYFFFELHSTPETFTTHAHPVVTYEQCCKSHAREFSRVVPEKL